MLGDPIFRQKRRRRTLLQRPVLHMPHRLLLHPNDLLLEPRLRYPRDAVRVQRHVEHGLIQAGNRRGVPQ